MRTEIEIIFLMRRNRTAQYTDVNFLADESEAMLHALDIRILDIVQEVKWRMGQEGISSVDVCKAMLS
ncbi:hypothetical protein DPMN_135091 [Dreissena polymorpha]|uniref:Uncharacterized protein n=1 Tax=Dreissena polymorpha TaxID=45954 RepID=A0A9D4JCI0_DREPO|nr:hypothetical protein DPMN_135091 [Dreissena polymorpha]